MAFHVHSHNTQGDVKMAFGKQVRVKTEESSVVFQENGKSIIVYVNGEKPFTVTPENKQAFLEDSYYYATMGV